MSIFTPPTLHDGFRWKNLNIGLLGGSFNPPHEGHIHISNVAKKNMNLDFIWWLVTPQNPLKLLKTNENYCNRIRKCKNLSINNPHIIISDIEQQISSTNTYQTVKTLKNIYPKTNFTWVGGTDLLGSFHKWDNYNKLLKEIPFIFVKRPPNIDIIKANHVTMNTIINKKIIYLLNQKTVSQSSSNIRDNIEPKQKKTNTIKQNICNYRI